METAAGAPEGRAGVEGNLGAGRRRWSVEARRRIVSAAFSPGAMVTEVARRHGVSTGQIYKWRDLEREGGGVTFARVVACTPPEADDRGGGGAVITVELAGARVGIGAKAAPALAAAILGALR